MLTLYTWLPTTPDVIVSLGIAPDVGHSALQVIDKAGVETYISFWPETDSLIGKITAALKPRTTRHPATYADEIDPAGPYMQRPANYVEELHGLDENRLVSRWRKLQESDYDLLKWNCSNVSKFLILSNMDPATFDAIGDATGCMLEDLLGLTAADEGIDVLRYLATAPFIDCRPDDVRRLALAYVEHSAAQETEYSAAAI